MTTRLTIVGGLYRELCSWPEWDQVFGSGGRAAAAVARTLVEDVRFICYADTAVAGRFMPRAKLDGIELSVTPCARSISFDYVHPMSIPVIRPSIGQIAALPPLTADDDVVLRFGMLESSGKVRARRCVYDPQSAYDAEPFEANGSHASVLAIVANRAEIRSLTSIHDPIEGARDLLSKGARVVIVKAGGDGAFVVTEEAGVQSVPAFASERTFTIGSGDVFAATFAAAWGVGDRDPFESAILASKSVAEYVNSAALPVRRFEDLSSTSLPEVHSRRRKVYLAGPFFSIEQDWLIAESLRCLEDLGQHVFSPKHEIGPGPAEVVAPADIAGIDESDCLFAVLNGLDSGTLFEVGYARAKNLPVYGFAQNVSEEDLKMIVGSGCQVYSDFVTALHHLTWAL